MSHLHLPFNCLKGERESLSHSCSKTAIDEVLQRGKTEVVLLPKLIQVIKYNIAANREGNCTCITVKRKE